MCSMCLCVFKKKSRFYLFGVPNALIFNKNYKPK